MTLWNIVLKSHGMRNCKQESRLIVLNVKLYSDVLGTAHNLNTMVIFMQISEMLQINQNIDN